MLYTYDSNLLEIDDSKKKNKADLWRSIDPPRNYRNARSFQHEAKLMYFRRRTYNLPFVGEVELDMERVGASINNFCTSS
mmetsp:Transcript_12301/g.22263  ORF Transcript_12301/g.22263 Transcript_12301/m.22263 type:complete len:80 (-) Transcript_12301:307-546(-)